MQDTLLSLQHITKNFGEGDVLRDISLDVARGEFVTLLGASGCGKTTTLRIISGLEMPDEGTVLLDGKDVTALPPERRPVNTVFQSYALFPHMNVEKNVAYGLRVRGMDKASIAKRVREMLELVQMEDYAKRMPSQLSGGQRQRIAIARALAPEPELLLLDEPLGALDLQLRRQMQLELKRLQKKLGITFVYITHDQEEAMAIADKIAILDNGRIQQYDTPEHLYHYPANLFVAKFMGNPPMNFIDAALSADGTRVEGAGFSLPLEQHMAQGGKKFAGHAVKVGVRSHLMAVHTEKVPQSMEMRLQIAENLGKEILISGMVGDSFVRVTVPENHDTFEQYKAISRSEKPFVYLTMTGVYNIFDTESGVNIALEK